MFPERRKVCFLDLGPSISQSSESGNSPCSHTPRSRTPRSRNYRPRSSTPGTAGSRGGNQNVPYGLPAGVRVHELQVNDGGCILIQITNADGANPITLGFRVNCNKDT